MARLITAFLSLMIASAVKAELNTNSVYARARATSAIVIECNVVDEGPLGHGSSIQKSYQVTRKAVFWSGVGLKLPETIWIHYDSQDYPEALRSGRETDFHKGDRFIAFVDLRDERKGCEFRVVRLEVPSKAEEIKKELKLSTEPAGSANGSQPIRSETNSTSSAAGSRR